MQLKRYLISLVTVLCLFVFSGCSLFIVNTVKDSGVDEVYSESVVIDFEDDSAVDESSLSENEDISQSPSDENSDSISESESLPEQTTTAKQTTTHQETTTTAQTTTTAEPEQEELIDIDGAYTTKEDVALYIYTYGCLPNNFITKSEAQDLGWEGGSLEPYAPGMCIGGNRFGNYEGLLPEADGRTYTECDIDTLGADKRGAKRIVFSNDGLIYYTEDHYESFELLYGEE